jgi:YD repeat-containing protein
MRAFSCLVWAFFALSISGACLAEGLVAPSGGTYCTASGFRGPTGGDALNAELASIRASNAFCGNANPVIWSLANTVISTGNGGSYIDACHAGTIAGTVTYADLVDTCNGVSNTQTALRAFPILGPSCPPNSTPDRSGSCYCNTGNAPGGDGKCYPVSIVVAPDNNQRCQLYVGEPIYPLNGSASEEVDLELGSLVPFELHYDTSLVLAMTDPSPAYSGAGIDAAANSGIFGGYWFASVDKKMGLSLDLKHITVYTGKGSYVVYALNPQGVYTSTVDSGKVVATASGYYYYDYDQNSIETYDLGGVLQSVSSAGGGKSLLTYSTAATSASVAPGAGYVISVADSFGRVLALSYATLASNAVRAYQIVGPTETVQFGYNPAGYLNSVGWLLSATQQSFSYDSIKDWAMTGVTDESSVSWLNYKYDGYGRAIATSFGNGAGAYFVSYIDSTGAVDVPYPKIVDVLAGSGVLERSFAWHTTAAAQIQLPNGTSATVIPTIAKNHPAAGSITQPAGSGCAASTKGATYDAAGNPLSRDDFNGNRRCFSYDSARSLPTMILEGRSSANSCSLVPSASDAQHPERLTTTTWHPDWVLKAQEAEPKKLTTWVYNGQSDPVAGGTASCVAPVTTLPDGKPLAVLCVRYEQATSDTTGALGLSAPVIGATRTWTYTYNQDGQVLSETMPKQSPTDVLSHTTTYVYYPTTSFSGSVGHTLGDLNTVTNPLGHVTTFTAYDKAGRLLSSKDANATVTSTTYWPRGWLRTQTVTPSSGSALTTTYDYWPTGLLKTVTMPDASTLNYAYDDAHRLTDVTDAAGNKVHYVLDNTGNRTSEQVSDASGQLASSISRVYDQLNRVQSTTGAMH